MNRVIELQPGSRPATDHVNNRRRVERVHLIEPLPARFQDQRAFIIDVSLRGLRVAHQQPVRPANPVEVEFEWQGERAVTECRIVRTVTERLDRPSSPPRPIYHSGLEIVSEPPNALRQLIAWHVSLALDEQKANARGIPPRAAQSFQTGRGVDYVRHELIGGQWRHLPTSDPRQPRHGFTVSAAQTSDEVALLRETYERGDARSREMLRRMAELSISNPEGIPTRRYMP